MTFYFQFIYVLFTSVLKFIVLGLIISKIFLPPENSSGTFLSSESFLLRSSRLTNTRENSLSFEN